MASLTAPGASRGNANEGQGLRNGCRGQGAIARAVYTVAIGAAAWTAALPGIATAQEGAPNVPSARSVQAGSPAAVGPVAVAPHLAGRTVEDIRIVGNRLVSSAEILNVVRTTVGAPFDPQTVAEDYQRVYNLRRFANVEAKVEPTATGVIVVFEVSEQSQIRSIRIVGNFRIPDETIRAVVNVEPGEAIEPFRISLARQAIEQLYRDRNFPNAQVEVLEDALTRSGVLIFKVTEGPSVRVRNINFVGANSFTEDRLKKQIRTRTWIWMFRPGTYDPDQIEDDVAALRRYYQSKGFFDARIGRKIIWSPDQSEVQIDFLIDEGPRYQVRSITFRGNHNLSERELREKLNLREGEVFDQEVLERDIRQIVRAYGPLGYIYQPQIDDPDYLRVDAKRVYSQEPGGIDLIYDIREGKPFRIGRIVVKGNTRTQDKVVLRQLRMTPGQLYDAGEMADARDRLRSTPYFEQVVMTPIGNDPHERDLLIEVAERRTASFTIGAGVNSNGGVGGNISYEQRNFDIGAVPDSWNDLFTDRAFVGAGQTFRVTFEPGTEATNASIRFIEPWLFDQPYSLTTEAYYRTRVREDYDERRGGGRVSLGKRFGYNWSASLTVRGEDVLIDDIDDPAQRAPEILDYEGHTTLTSLGIGIRRDTTAGGFLPYRGTSTNFGIEQFGVFGGETFTKFSAGFNWYHTLDEDLLDRRTILAVRLDAGYIEGDAPFFERFYGGGIGSLRGFEYRGISPRSGPDDDRIGGDFIATGTVEVSFPLAGDNLRGVVFSDFGTVEEDFRFGTLRSSVGAGIRIQLPIFGQAPLALDFAIPVTKDDDDDTQVFSFSFGIVN